MLIDKYQGCCLTELFGLTKTLFITPTLFLIFKKIFLNILKDKILVRTLTHQDAYTLKRIYGQDPYQYGALLYQVRIIPQPQYTVRVIIMTNIKGSQKEN